MKTDRKVMILSVTYGKIKYQENSFKTNLKCSEWDTTLVSDMDYKSIK